MPIIKVKKTEYYYCPYCHKVIPDYAICNCVKIYNQALEDFIIAYSEYAEHQYGRFADDEIADMLKIKEQIKRQLIK